MHLPRVYKAFSGSLILEKVSICARVRLVHRDQKPQPVDLSQDLIPTLLVPQTNTVPSKSQGGGGGGGGGGYSKW